MADFPKIETQPEKGEVFSTGQIDNWAVGVNRGVDGFKQALEEAKEALGFTPEGTAEFETQEMKRDQKILREAAADDQELQLAGVAEFVGEALPLFAVPAAGGIVRGAAAGAAASAGFFQDDVSESRVDDIALGGAFGGLFGRLIKGGRAKGEADGAIKEAEQLLLPAPPQKLLPPPQVPRGAQSPRLQALPNPHPGGQRLLTDGRRAALTADDFQQAGRSPIPGFQGVPKPRVRQQLTPAQRALAAGGTQPAVKVEAAMRKAAVFAANAKRKAEKLSLQVEKAVAKGSKPHIVQKLRDKATAAMQDKLAAGAMARAFQSMRQGTARAPAGAEAAAQAQAFTTASKPRVRVGSEGGKPSVQGPAAVAQDAAAVVQDAAPLATIKGKRAIIDGKASNKWDMLNEIKKHLPGNEQGHLHDPANFTVPDVVEMYNRIVGAAKKAGGPGGKQGGFINTDLQAGITGAVAGGALGGATTDSPAGAGVGALAGAFLGARGARLLDKVTTNKQKAGMRAADKAGGEFNEKVTRFTKAKDLSGEAINTVLTDGRKVLDQFMGNTMTRIRDLSPRVAAALSNTEFQQHARAQHWIGQSEKHFAAIEAAGLSDVQRRTFKIALLNSTEHAQRYLRKIGKNDAADAVAAFDRNLKEVGEYLGEVGLGENLRKNYFPRTVKDTSYFENIQEVNTYLEQLAKKKGVSLSNFEKEVAITEAINGALNKGKGTAYARAAASLQKRTVKVDGKNVDAYYDPELAYKDYIESITNQVERRRFFDGQGVKIDDLGPDAESVDTLASRLKDQLKDGTMSVEEIDEVAQLLRMRFGPGEQAPSRAVQNFKNLTYMGLLGNPMSAMTQFGDMAISAHKNGIRNTVASLAENIAGKGKLKGLDKEELLGIRNAATDFAGNKNFTRDMMAYSLKWGGFSKMDTLGKNTFIGAAMRKAKQQSPDEFNGKWRSIFDPEAAPGDPTPRTDELFKKVQGFEEITPENREDIGFMLWNELSEAQPIALSAMPEKYLQHPTGRMAYMLQSFTLKTFDIMRKDIVRKLANPETRVEGIKNATKFTGLFVSLNGNVDMAKNFLQGKDEALTDTMINNALKMFGMSKYMAGSIAQDGIGSAIKQSLGPTALPDALTDAKRAAGMVPLVGRNLIKPFVE